MYWTHALNYINNYLKNLNNLEKVLIYLLPLIILSSFMYLWAIKPQTAMHSDTQIMQLKKQISSISEYQSKPTMFAIVLEDLEKFALQKELDMEKIRIVERSVDLEVKGSLDNLIGLINYCENYDSYSKIKTLNMGYNKKEGLNTLNMVISFDKAYIKSKKQKTQSFQSLENVFIKDTQKMQLELLATVGEYALINNQWLKVNDTFHGYILSDVGERYVKLEKDNQTYNLKLFND